MNEAADRAIREWMAHLLATDGIERYDDLHINKIAPEFKDPNCWAAGMVECFALARRIRSDAAPHKVLALLCSLRSGQHSILRDMDELSTQMDRTPPSLYLFHEEQEPWRERAQFEELLALRPESFPLLQSTKVVLWRWTADGVRLSTLAFVA